MAGLMPNAPARNQAMPAETPGGPGPGARRASSEETQLFQEFLANVSNAIYQPRAAEGIAAIFTGPAPVEMLAQVVSGAIARVSSSAGENGMPITIEMVTAATAAISEDVGKEMARSVGVEPLSDEQVQAVFLRSTELLRDQHDDAQFVDETARAPRGGPGEAPAPAPRGGSGQPPMGMEG